MTDLDLYTGLPKVGNSLAVWADDARQAASVAISLAPTPFVPASLRGRDDKITAANITAAILTGAEVGMTPMASLRSIVVIQGTPAMTALAMRGLVQSAGHDVWKVESNDRRAIYAGRRRGSDIEERSVWTIERANKLGLTGKQNWKNQPEAMLIARATSEVCRLVGADVLLGLPYSAEEMADTAETEPQRTARRRAQREPAPMPEPELEAAPEPVPSQQESASEPEPPAPDDGITAAQSKALHASLCDAKLSDRDAGLAYIGDILGREITSTKELSRADASFVIDTLKREAEAPPPETALPEPPLDEGGAA